MRLSNLVPNLPYSRRVMNLGDLLTQAAQKTPDSPAIIWGIKQWNWRQLNARVDKLAQAMASMGIVEGDRILVQARNGNHMFESMFACFKLGAIWVPANFRLTPEDISDIAESSGATALISQVEFSEHIKEVTKRITQLKAVISIGGEVAGSKCYDTLVENASETLFASVPVEYDDPLWFFYTSGTTGNPKAAVLTHGQMAFVVTNHLADLMPDTRPSDRSLVIAPLSHGAGIHQLTQVARGVASILPVSNSIDQEEIWKLIEEHRVTNMFTVPSIVKTLIEHPAIDIYDHYSLKYVVYAGAPMLREDQKNALIKLGPVLVQYFGLGEVTGNITVLPPELHSIEDGKLSPVGTCGYARTGMQIAIMDASGKTLTTNETGEICVIGPAVFAGYYNNEKANLDSFRDGWFRTGDLGHLNEKGFLFITGRASDMYISGGSNIYPLEIEEKLISHPCVSEVAVLGIPDKKWGEIGVAIIVTDADASLSNKELQLWMRGKIAGYKIPKRTIFCDELPKSGYGKVLKKSIREKILNGKWPVERGNNDSISCN